MKISVVIPTLNEADRIGAVLACPDFGGLDVELIVSDGGSRDGTIETARAAGAIVVSGSKGRGQQLRRGADRATGDVILFLHADTMLGAGALAAIRRALDDPRVVGGNFRLIFDGDSDFARWLTGFYAKLRARAIYYGDSAIFVRRRSYDTLGGIKALSLMEDFDFVRRMERLGATACITEPPATTSSRRFDGRKPRRIYAQWIIIHVLYLLGVPPRPLAWLYRSTTHSPARAQT